MIVQIYAINNNDDAVALCNMGVDHIGIVASENGDSTRGIVSKEKAKELVSIIKENGKIASLIIDSVDMDVISQWVQDVEPDIFHLCRHVSNAYLLRLKAVLNDRGVSLMYAVPVKDRSAIEYAKSIQEYVDFIILDSPFQSKQMPGFIGASGRTHDWKISAEIVKAVYKPVILGGGLSPENVQEAIRVVHPFGVDAKSSLDLPNGFGKKDLSRVKEFIEKVRNFADE